MLRQIGIGWLISLLLAQPLWADSQTELVIGAENDAAPWSYADGGGYVNELVQAVFKTASLPVRLEVMPYARCKALAVAGKLAGCFTTSKRPDLASLLLFPRQPVIDAHNMLVVSANSPIDGCDPGGWGKPLQVGVVNGYEYTATVERLIGRDLLRPDVSNSETSNLRKLAAGRLEAAVVNLDEVKRLDFVLLKTGLTPQQFKLACDLGGEPGYIAFSPKHPLGALALRSFEAGFDRLKQNGGLERIQQAWRTRLAGGT